MHIIKKIITYVRRLPRKYSIGGAILIIVVIVLGVHVLTRTSADVAAAPGISHVHLASVASLSSSTGPLPVTGKVTSLSEATILAEDSGEIVSLPHALGDRVAAGSVIASFEGSSQRAVVLQAQGAYEAAQAALSKASGSTAQNSSITSSQASQSVENARTSAQASLQSAYAALDDAVHTKADQLFSNPRSSSPSLLSFTIPDSQIVINIQNERPGLETVLAHAHALADTSTSANIDTNATQMIANAQTVQAFLNDLIQAMSVAVPNQVTPASTISADQASIAAARSEVIAAISSVTSAKSAYDADLSGAATAANSAQSGTGSDIAAATANVKSALGALNAAQANLEKTVVRSPISGTIVSLSITRGDFVTAFTQVADVSNPGALEIVTNVTPDDAKTLSVGGKALINETTNGVIVSIAPALDPSTGKIQVKVGITGNQSDLTDGDTVTVALDRSTTGTKQTATNKLPALQIPITAAKITPSGPVVFTVKNGVLVSQPIVFGNILGDQVLVASGLTAETDIVTDARGLTDGQTVVVDTQ